MKRILQIKFEVNVENERIISVVCSLMEKITAKKVKLVSNYC